MVTSLELKVFSRQLKTIGLVFSRNISQDVVLFLDSPTRPFLTRYPKSLMFRRILISQIVISYFFFHWTWEWNRRKYKTQFYYKKNFWYVFALTIKTLRSKLRLTISSLSSGSRGHGAGSLGGGGALAEQIHNLGPPGQLHSPVPPQRRHGSCWSLRVSKCVR